jgi:hypothetical protein
MAAAAEAVEVLDSESEVEEVDMAEGAGASSQALVADASPQVSSTGKRRREAAAAAAHKNYTTDENVVMKWPCLCDLWGFSPAHSEQDKAAALDLLHIRGKVVCAVCGAELKAHKKTVADHFNTETCTKARMGNVVAATAAAAAVPAKQPPPFYLQWAPQHKDRLIYRVLERKEAAPDPRRLLAMVSTTAASHNMALNLITIFWRVALPRRAEGAVARRGARLAQDGAAAHGARHRAARGAHAAAHAAPRRAEPALRCAHRRRERASAASATRSSWTSTAARTRWTRRGRRCSMWRRRPSSRP